MLVNTLIVDDEYIEGEQLQEILRRKCPSIQNVKYLQSPVDAILHIKEHPVDLLFLDIQMPKMNAFEFIEIIGSEHLPPIVFTTAHSKYAVQAFKVRALDYLLKPIDDNELMAAVDKASALTSGELEKRLNSLVENQPESFGSRIAITEGQTHHFIKLKDIVRVEGSGSYSAFYLSDGKKFTTCKPLNAYSARLENQGFVRSHQSHLANLSYVSSYHMSNGGELFLENADRIPVSARRKTHVKQALGLK